MKRVLGIFLFTLILVIFLGVFQGESFLSDYNLKNLARLIAFLSILAIGEALVIITGGIDLSVGSVVGLSAVLVTILMSPAEAGASTLVHGYSPFLAVCIVMVVMLGVGLVQSQMVTRLGLQPFVVTLGGLMVLRGVAQILTHGGAVSIGNAHPGFKKLGSFVQDTTAGGTGFHWLDPGSYASVTPVPVLILLVIAGVVHFLMGSTVFGQYLYAIGRNEEAARYSGINLKKFKTMAYLICSGLACLTGVLYASYLSSVQPSSLGSAFELYAIAAAVLGGVSLRGGEGAVLGIIIGAALMRLITNGINLWGISSFWEQTVTGLVILAAALLDTLVHQRGAGRKTA